MDVNIQSVEFNPVTSTAARVAILLEQRIINCEFIPGSRLVEKELVNVFKISRSPVLEALRLVANDGLVTIESRRGARVSQMNPTDLREVYECRLVLEGLATERAAERYDDDDKVTLRHISLIPWRLRILMLIRVLSSKRTECSQLLSMRQRKA